MSEKYINDLNIEYLINKEKIKYFENNKLKNANKKDKKFYRKRILNLTKDFLLFKETEEQILPDVKCSFELYVKTCVEYFKILDRHDIIQEDYSDLEEKEITKLLNSEELNIENINNENEANSLLMRSINIKPSLEKFIKRTTLKKEEILPIQKEINLEEPYLKNKGICKKKNIYNNYGEVTNKEIEKK